MEVTTENPLREVALFEGEKKNEEHLVTTIKIPRYQPLPEVIKFKERFFQKAISFLKNKIVYHEIHVWEA